MTSLTMKTNDLGCSKRSERARDVDHQVDSLQDRLVQNGCRLADQVLQHAHAIRCAIGLDSGQPPAGQSPGSWEF